MAASPAVSWSQIRTLTSANMRSRYRGTIVGLFWVVLSPLLMFAVQGYAFKIVLRIQYENYPLFLLTGLMPWLFFQQSLHMSTTLFATQARLLKSFPIHPVAVLLSVLLDNLTTLLLVFFLVLLPVLLLQNSNELWRNFLLLPLPLLAVLIATVGTTWMLATLQVFFHDTRYIVDFVLSIAFFLTPIAYPPQFVGNEFQWLVDWNPIAIWLAPIQALSQHELPTNYVFILLKSFVFASLVLGAAALFWHRKKNLVYFRL